MRRFTWILLSQNAQVTGVDASTLTVGFKNAGARDSFLSGGSEEVLRQALIDLLGAEWKIDSIIDQAAMPGDVPVRVDRPAVPSAGSAPDTPPGTPPDGPPGDPAWATGAPDGPRGAAAETIAAARSNIAPTRPAGAGASVQDEDGDKAGGDHGAAEGAHRDDPDVEDDGLQGAALLERELGATVIEDIPHE